MLLFADYPFVSNPRSLGLHCDRDLAMLGRNSLDWLALEIEAHGAARGERLEIGGGIRARFSAASSALRPIPVAFA